MFSESMILTKNEHKEFDLQLLVLYDKKEVVVLYPQTKKREP